MAEGLARQQWRETTQESAVEHMYSHGAESYGEFHNGYLNFGLWEQGISEYVPAAENLVRRMGALLALGPGDRLLDCACGMGTQDVFLFRQFGPLEIDAMDVTWKHIQHGTRRARAANCESQVRFRHGTAVDLPFDAETFTRVMSIEGAEHFYTRERFLAEAWRVLRPGGVLALADYTLKRAPRNRLERVVVEAARRLWKIPRENVETAESYRATLSRAGFTAITIEEVGALTYPGYYFEQRRCLRELVRIRGFVGGLLGHSLDLAAYQAYARGLVEYVLVRGEKPAAASAS